MTIKPRPPLQPGETRAFPVLPLRDIVVFPHMIVPLFVGREKSIRALEEVMRSDKQILLVAQKNASDDEPSTDGIYAMGTLASELRPIAAELTPAPRVYVDANLPVGIVSAMRHELAWDVLFVLEDPALRRASRRLHPDPQARPPAG